MPSSGKINTILAIKIKPALCERPLETVNSGCLWGPGDLKLAVHYIPYYIVSRFSYSLVAFTILKQALRNKLT